MRQANVLFAGRRTGVASEAIMQAPPNISGSNTLFFSIVNSIRQSLSPPVEECAESGRRASLDASEADQKVACDDHAVDGELTLVSERDFSG